MTTRTVRKGRTDETFEHGVTSSGHGVSKRLSSFPLRHPRPASVRRQRRGGAVATLSREGFLVGTLRIRFFLGRSVVREPHRARGEEGDAAAAC